MDEGPECNPHNGHDLPYPNEPNYLISKDTEKLRFFVSLPGKKNKKMPKKLLITIVKFQKYFRGSRSYGCERVVK